jgi:uncharacterized protein (DUF488 family)
VELLTVGHGTLPEADFGDLLSDAGVQMLIDVRRAPGSRRHPHFGRSQMEIWVPARGIRYRWEPGLGGWRKPAADSPNTALRNHSFRGYADYMATEPFWSALDGVLADTKHLATAVMCSEAVYWRCHRRLIADAAELSRQVTVKHLGHDGRLSNHRLTEGVRAKGAGVIYDGGEQRLG